MATRIDLDKARVKPILEQAIASTKRSMNTVKNPAFLPILEKDLADLNTALNTLTDTK